MKIKKGDYSVIPDEEKDKSNNKGSGPRGDEGQGEVGSTEFEDDVKKMEEIPQTGNTIIIYCSDDIDNIDIVKKGGDPDFTKIASTGGNRRGFIPPFQWVEKNKINPSVFVYLTDTGGEMPDPSRYGIRKYAKKTFWFICSPMIYNQPTFGKIIHVPVAGLK